MVIINRFADNFFNTPMSNSKKELFFTHNLLNWDKQQNLRTMPWKGEKDPYKIWLSEIILQQTRVEQGWAYYNRFIKKYPTIKKLALAPEKDVFKLWEGLGYYTRCRNLIATAKFIANELNGKFPDDYESILKLKGVGPYTAAAIASFAFNLPYAVVDGNVMRVLSRFFGIKKTIDDNEGKKFFFSLANKLIEKEVAGLYNQAIMDFGATICKPQSPLCPQCVLKTKCEAYLQDAVNEYPVKSKKLVKKQRWLYYIVAEYKGKIFVRKRIEKDIWQNLYEFFLIETGKQFSADEIIASTTFKEVAGKHSELINISRVFKQQLTHQTIHGFFIHTRLKKAPLLDGYQLLEKQALLLQPFPRFITAYFEESNFFKTKV
ncbi:MAG: A/G-specific adenine glycosylase [Ferruginibacter sp.]